MAFGTGHHESTQLVINQMLKLKMDDYNSLLDLGTGSGILSILAKKMGIEDFTAMGMDETGAQETMAYVDTLRERISKVRTVDKKIKTFAKQEKKKEKERLELFMG